MKYLIETLVEYIKSECPVETGKVVFVMPSYPSKILLEVGNELEEYFSRIRNRKVKFIYGIAYKLGQHWNIGTDAERDSLRLMREKGWYNENDNLTELRNTQKDENVDNLVVIMAGYEHINDRESLRDFFHLDQQTVWNICLKRSFKDWLAKSLEEYINVEENKGEIEKIEAIFKTLYSNGLSDLILISTYLEKQDFAVAREGNDAYRLVLSNLSSFTLPCLIGLDTRYADNESFACFLDHALNFFSYSMFLEISTRNKVLDKINKYKQEVDQGNIEQPDREHLGNFGSIDELIQSLIDYITHRANDAKQELYSADFVYILKEILEFKIITGKPKPSKNPKKLKGMPLDVFLRAIWITLGDFIDGLSACSMFIREDIKSITIRSIAFRYDFDSSEEDDATSDKEKAENFLIQAIGGIDKFLEDNVNIELMVNDGKVTVPFESKLLPEIKDDLSYQKTHTAEPWLKFEVLIQSDQIESLRREFYWALPQNHQCRIIADLFGLAVNSFKGNALPSFGIPYLAELFSASEEEEVNRILSFALQSNFEDKDLLQTPGIDDKDQIKKLLVNLSKSYQHFIAGADHSGFFSALDSSLYDDLRKDFTMAYSTFLDNRSKSHLASILFKAFLIVSKEELNQSDWGWRDNIKGAVVTPLHPALLEMIRHQHTYLCESFCTYVQEALEQPKNRMLAERNWARVIDLATLSRPIYGVLEKNQILNTNAKGYGYLHLIGDFHGESAYIDSHLLLEYDDDWDEEITDAELFEESRASQLIKQNLADYLMLYPFAEDGISIGAFCGKDVQAVIAGIDSFLKQVLEKRKDEAYALSLTMFSDSRDDSAVLRWITAWKDRWQAAELSSLKNYYSKCEISINYRVVSASENYSQFRTLLRGLGLDIMILTDFIKSDESKFVPLDEDLVGTDDYSDYRKFPILEKTCCKITGGGKDQQRERVLSNQRFRVGWHHAEVMAYLKSETEHKKHVVTSRSNYQPWKDIIDAAHTTCTWVLCIDPVIDEQLLYKGSNIREIIGLGTGVGPHGENNFTVSTEKFAMKHIKQKIRGLIISLFENLSPTESEKITDCLVEHAVQIAGLSVVKATGPIRFVRELIANSMVRKLTTRGSNLFCDEIISLDAFSHWFNDSEKRPDLLRIRAKIVDGFFEIEAQIIECKLAMYGEGFLEKAREQIESGIRRLAGNFRPRGETPVGIRDKPDQRYWWMQLHRLIANKGEIDKPNYQKAILALERLSEGYFNIKWQAAAVAIWTDSDSSLEHNEEWQYSYDGQELFIAVVTAGKHFIKAVCLDDFSAIIFNETVIRYEYPKPAEIRKPEDEPNGKEHEEVGGQENEAISEIINQNDDNDVRVIEKKLPGRILLGSYTPGRNIYWEFGHPDLPNRHILVFGTSGTGKTYTIQALLCELGKLSQNSLIVDYTNGFTNNQLEAVLVEKLKPSQHIIRKKPLSINPFRQQFELIDDTKLAEDPVNTAERVTGVFVEVYQLGDQQKSALYNAIRSGIAKKGNEFYLVHLFKELEAIRAAGGPAANSAASVISKIQPFIDMNPFGQEDPDSWEKLFNDTVSRCHIVQLAGYTKDTARLITEFSLIDLYWYYRTRGSKDDPKVIVLDEIQNLDHRLESPIGQFLTEGRKFGISLILATQTLSNLGKDERDRLFQAGHKLFFKPADTEIRSFAQILSDATKQKSEEWVNRLSSLKRGECYTLGSAYNEHTKMLEVGKSFKIKIIPLEERF